MSGEYTSENLSPVNMDISTEEVLAPRQNWTSTAIGRVTAASVLAAEISPLNEVMRWGAFGIALKYGDTATAAAVAGSTTLALEGVAALVTADVIDTSNGKKYIDKVNDKLAKTGADKLLNTNIATETGVAMIGGSSVVTVLKHRQNPSRTRQQNRKYGLTSATGITVMTTAQAIAIGEGIQHPNPVTLGVAAIAVGASIGGYKWTMRTLRGNIASSKDQQQ